MRENNFKFQKQFKKSTALMLCLALLFSMRDSTTIVSHAAEAQSEIIYSDSGIEYSISTDNGTATIRTGTGFAGGNLPDTVTYEGNTYTIKEIRFNAFQNYTGNITKLPSNITTIGSNAFAGCTNFNPTSLPDTLTSIGTGAFNGCTSLNIPALPSGLTVLPLNAFGNCTSLALSSLPEGLQSINACAFQDCTSLALTCLPANITTIANSAFKNCTNLALTSLPESITSIEAYTFYGCSSLQLTSLPENITTIGESAFSYCSNLALTSLPDTLTSLGEAAFFDCEKLAVTHYPKGLTKIPDNAFYKCTSLTQLEIPEGVTTIGMNAFYGCFNLTTITLPETLTTIDSQASSDCLHLELASLPNAVTKVGYQAFWNCDSIYYLALGDNITDYGGQIFDINPVTYSYPDIVISSEDTATYQTIKALNKASAGNINLPWDGTQEGLNQTSQNYYVSGEQTIDADLTLENGKSLIIVTGGNMIIRGNLTIQNGAEVSIAEGGILTVEGSITNYGIITNYGTIVNHGKIDNQNDIQSSQGTLEGNDIQGNAPYMTDITVTAYTGKYDNAPHDCIIEITGTKAGDQIYYSTTYADNHIKHPERVSWSTTCPQYTTVQDTSSLVTVKVTRMIDGIETTITLLDAKVVIQKVDIEIKELPQASSITEGDILKKSTFTGGKVVIKGTDIVIDNGNFFWSTSVQNTVPALSDSNRTEYDIYYYGGASTGYSYNTVSEKITVTVNECFHLNTERECKDERPSTCTEKGFTGNTYCKQCGDLLTEGLELPLLDHIWDEGRITREATTTQAGEKIYTCTICSSTKTETIPKLPDGTETTLPPAGSETPGSTPLPDNSSTPGQNTPLPDNSSAPGQNTPLPDSSNAPGQNTPLPDNSSAPAQNTPLPDSSSIPNQDDDDLPDKYKDAIDSDTMKDASDLKKGMYIKDQKTNGIYRITTIRKASGTVSYETTLKKTSRVSIPKSIICGKLKFTVTSVAANALKNNTKIKNLVIGANVNKIGKKAFFGCKSLKQISIKTKKLTAKKVGANAFAKIETSKQQLKISIPKKKANSYIKWLRKRGISKKANMIKK